MIQSVPAKRDRIILQVCPPTKVGKDGMIHEVHAKFEQILCTSMSAYGRWSK
jgi:hypothetical protein